MSDERGAPNLDLINMVQRARLAHDADARPTQMTGVYWVEFKRPTAAPAPTARAGVFIIPTTLDQIDALWAAVKQATERGDLGYKAKAATASRGGRPDAADREIHVATYDGADRADLDRVRAALTALLAPFGIDAAALVYQRADA